MRTFNMFISLGGFSVSTAIYVIIYVALAIRARLHFGTYLLVYAGGDHAVPYRAPYRPVYRTIRQYVTGGISRVRMRYGATQCLFHGVSFRTVLSATKRHFFTQHGTERSVRYGVQHNAVRCHIIAVPYLYLMLRNGIVLATCGTEGVSTVGSASRRRYNSRGIVCCFREKSMHER